MNSIMKKTLFAVIPVVLILLVTGCDAFLTPTRGRENPLDPENPVLPVLDFSAQPETNTSIRLTWTPEAYDDGSFPGMVVVMSSNGTPVNQTDGTVVYDAPASEGEYLVQDLDESTPYYFSAWTYKDIDSELQYTGPFSRETKTYLYVSRDVPLTVDGWVNSFPNQNFNDADLWAGLSTDTYYSLIKFEDLPEGVIISAELVLYCENSPAVTSRLEVKRILDPWDSISVTFNDADNGSFSASFLNNTVDVATSYVGPVTVDVSDAVREFMENGEPNYGFRLNEIQAGTSQRYSSSEDGVNPGPRLKAEYYTLE